MIDWSGRPGRKPAANGPARPAASVCVECGSTDTLLSISDDGYSICLRCVTTYLHGCIPEHVGLGGSWPTYWYWCVCGRQVRDGYFAGEVNDWYRGQVEGVPSGGVMLCRKCAEAAGVPLPAPAPARAPALPGNVIDLASRRSARRR